MTKTLFKITTISMLSAGTLYAQKKSPLQTSYTSQLRNSDDNGNGSVAVDRFAIRGGVPLMRENGSLLAIGFRYTLDRYDFENTAADWEAIHQADLGLASRWKINDQWLWANYAVAGIAAEEGSDKDDGLIFNFISIAEYKVNDKLTIGPGIGASSEIDRDISLNP